MEEIKISMKQEEKRLFKEYIENKMFTNIAILLEEINNRGDII